MVVIGVVGVISYFVLPWVTGMFSMEQRSRDELSALNEQRIDESFIKNHLSNTSVMRSGLLTCTKPHLLVVKEALPSAPRIFKTDKNTLDFVSSKPLGVATVVSGKLKVAYTGKQLVPGSLLFLRSINGDNQNLFVRVKTVVGLPTALMKVLDFDYTITKPAFHSCSLKNPSNAQSYMTSFENKRFSLESVHFLRLSLATNNASLALKYQIWPKIGYLALNSINTTAVTNVTDSTLYESIDSLSVDEKFEGEQNSEKGNYSVVMSFKSIKTKTVQDGGVGVAGANLSTHVISGAYTNQGLEIGNIKTGTALVVKPPKVTCSVIYKKINGSSAGAAAGTALYELRVLFSEASSINTSTNPLSAYLQISSSSGEGENVECYRSDQYSSSERKFTGDSFNGDIALSAQGGATATNPVYCIIKVDSQVSGNLTYLAITGSSARQYSPTCDPVELTL